MVYSGFWRRVGARLVDLLIFTPLSIVNYNFFKDTNPIIYQINYCFLYLITLAYNVLLIYFKGATIGKMVFRIRVVKTDGSRVTLINAFFRELIVLAGLPFSFAENFAKGDAKKLSTIINNIYLLFFVIEHFVYFTNSNQKTLHDYIGDTVVVLKNKT